MKKLLMISALFLITLTAQASETNRTVSAPSWTLVITTMAAGTVGSVGAGAGVTVPGFENKHQCEIQAQSVQKRRAILDAYCIQVN